MDSKQKIEILRDLWNYEQSDKYTENEIRIALTSAIDSIRFQEEIVNIVHSADMIIQEIYGATIIEGYADVFNLIEDKVKIIDMED